MSVEHAEQAEHLLRKLKVCERSIRAQLQFLTHSFDDAERAGWEESEAYIKDMQEQLLASCTAQKNCWAKLRSICNGREV